MIIIIGLGNPGEKYEKTRHNIGRNIILNLKEKNDFPDFKFLKKANALNSEGIINKEKILLTLPETFMNESGKTAKFLFRNYKTKSENIFVVHDDIDLDIGKIKISLNRGSAGHKGIESIIKEIGSKNFIRFRIGIKPANIKKKITEKLVLQKFTKEEKKIIEKISNKTIEAIELLLKENIKAAMNKFN